MKNNQIMDMKPKDVIASDPYSSIVYLFDSFIFFLQLAISLAFVHPGKRCARCSQFRWRCLFNRLVIPHVGSCLPVHYSL